jgi:uncharacterized protein (TIGR03067 family)
MNPLALSILTATLVAVDLQGNASSEQDLDRLRGTWTLVAMEIKGNPIPGDKVKERVAVIDGKKFTDRVDSEVLAAGTISLDATRSPKTIDVKFTEGSPKGQTSLAIYELDGDILKACCAEPGKDRPSVFTTKEGTGHMLVTYKRAKR